MVKTVDLETGSLEALNAELERLGAEAEATRERRLAVKQALDARLTKERRALALEAFEASLDGVQLDPAEKATAYVANVGHAVPNAADERRAAAAASGAASDEGDEG